MIDFADLEAVDICPRRDNLSSRSTMSTGYWNFTLFLKKANKTTSTERMLLPAYQSSESQQRKSEVNSLKETNIRRLLMSCGHFKRQCAFKPVTIGLATQKLAKIS